MTRPANERADPIRVMDSKAIRWSLGIVLEFRTWRQNTFPSKTELSPVLILEIDSFDKLQNRLQANNTLLDRRVTLEMANLKTQCPIF